VSRYFLDRDDALTVGAIVCGAPLVVRDFGLLDAAGTRPRSPVFGIDAYPDAWGEAAALVHSLASDHALLDGNRRTAWAAAWVFLGCNGVGLRPGFDVDAASDVMIDVMIDVATGMMDASDRGTAVRGFAA
jgi:death-on-curing protein